MRLHSGLEWVQGYHGAPLEGLSKLYDAGIFRCPRLPGIFAWLNARFYLVADPGKYPRLVPAGKAVNFAGQQLWLCEDPEFMPRVFFAAHVEPTTSDENVLDALCRAHASDHRVFVAGRRGTALAGRKAPGEVGLLDLAPNRIMAEVAATGDAFLFFSEAWYPAWTGFVDGVRVPVERVNVMFRGVTVPKGRHSVEMVYRSLPLQIGLWLSLVGWVALAGWVGSSIRHPAPSPNVTA